MKNIILASSYKIEKKILTQNGIKCSIQPSKINSESIKHSWLEDSKGPKKYVDDAIPELISLYVANTRAEIVSLKSKNKNKIVIGTDNVIDFNEELILKPKNQNAGLKILKKLNGKTHHLITSVCILKNGIKLWNYTDKITLTMKKMTNSELESYLLKTKNDKSNIYDLYKIEIGARSIFSKIEKDKNTVMGLPIKLIKDYLKNFDKKNN